MLRGLKVSIILLLLVSQGWAQRHYFVSYSVKDGLAQSQVRDIIQTSDQYLWIATVGGASRFNGNTFTTYNKTKGLLDNLVTSLYEVEDGKLLAACKGGLSVISNDQVSNILFPGQWSRVMAFDMAEYSDELVLATNGSGLLFMSKDTVFRQVDLGSNNKNFVRSLDLDDHGLLIGTKAGLLRYRDGNIETVVDSISVNRVVHTGDQLWVTTTADGILLIENEQVKRFTVDSGLTSNHQRDVCIDANNDPWLISKFGIQRFNGSTQQFESVRFFDPDLEPSLRVLYSDRESNVWIGTDGSGVLKYTGDEFETYTSGDGLVSDAIMCVRQQPDGAMWFATYGGGVVKKDEEHYINIDFSDGLMNSTVWSLEVIEDDLVWIGTSSGINIYDHGEISEFAFNDSLPFRRVSAIFQDSRKAVWIGTRDGLIVYQDGELVTPEPLSSRNINEVRGFVQRGNVVWLTSNSGLYGYNIETGQLSHLDTEDGIQEKYLSCITLDGFGNIWVGTDEGICLYAPGEKRIQPIAVSEKVSSNIVNFLAAEGQTRLWVGTDHGLFSLDLQHFINSDSLLIRSYIEHDGVVGQECNQNAAFQDQQQRMWFGTNSGLVRFDPSAANEVQKRILAIHFTDIQLNFESIAQRLDLEATDFESNPFEYAANRITFRYAGIHYANPEKVYYSYKLVGSDEDWSPKVRENYVTYAYLPPGDYEFQVRAKVDNAPWSEHIASFRFYIQPPFYQRWWFILLCLLLVGIATYMVYYQIDRERQRKRRLKDAQNKAKVLGLEQQTLNAHMNRHFIFNALNSIQYYINTQDRKQANMYLTNFAALVRKNLDSAQVESIYLKDELERLKLYMNLEQMRFKDRFDYEITVDPELDTDGLLVPSMILQPFVENSIMHGILPSENRGTIQINIKAEARDLVFQIKDNGIGIETSVRQKNGTSLHVSNGMKITRQRMELLASMTRRNYKVDGPMEMRDHNQVLGTIVTITIPQHFRAIADISAG